MIRVYSNVTENVTEKSRFDIIIDFIHKDKFVSRDFNWIIDEAKIYNRALTDEEIRQQAKIAGF